MDRVSDETKQARRCSLTAGEMRLLPASSPRSRQLAPVEKEVSPRHGFNRRISALVKYINVADRRSGLRNFLAAGSARAKSCAIRRLR